MGMLLTENTFQAQGSDTHKSVARAGVCVSCHRKGSSRFQSPFILEVFKHLLPCEKPMYHLISWWWFSGRRICRCLMQSAMNFLKDNDPSAATGVLHRMDNGRHRGGYYRWWEASLYQDLSGTLPCWKSIGTPAWIFAICSTIMKTCVHIYIYIYIQYIWDIPVLRMYGLFWIKQKSPQVWLIWSICLRLII